MSVINKKPLISKVVSNLTAAEKNKLLSGLNGGLSKSVKVFNSLTTTDKDISLLDLKFDDGVKTGYLIYNDLVSVFIAFYSDTQRLSLFNLDITQHTYTSSREYLTIDELRNVVELGLIEQGEHLKVQADDVDSGSATAGYVLTADGEGGATWEEGGISEITPDIIISTGVSANTPLVAKGDGTSQWATFKENQFLAPEYDTTASYVAGDLCLHLGVLYVCTANTSGTFDDSDWQPTTIAGSVLGLLNTGV